MPFVFHHEDEVAIPVFTFDGGKGVAKTATYIPFPGRGAPVGVAHPDSSKVVFSYDREVLRILNGMFPEWKPYVEVIDAVALRQISDAAMLHWDNETHEYIKAALNRHLGPWQTEEPMTNPDGTPLRKADGTIATRVVNMPQLPRPHYVIHDGLDILSEIEEMRMRFHQKLKPFQGFAERSYWKQRRLGLRELLELSIRVATDGVIFVTYVEQKDIYKDGAVVETREVPKWLDLIEKRTDVWLRCLRFDDLPKKKSVFQVVVKSSKLLGFPQGQVFDVTGKVDPSTGRVDMKGKTFVEQVNPIAWAPEIVRQEVTPPPELHPVPEGTTVKTEEETQAELDALGL